MSVLQQNKELLRKHDEDAEEYLRRIKREHQEINEAWRPDIADAIFVVIAGLGMSSGMVSNLITHCPLKDVVATTVDAAKRWEAFWRAVQTVVTNAKQLTSGRPSALVQHMHDEDSNPNGYFGAMASDWLQDGDVYDSFYGEEYGSLSEALATVYYYDSEDAEDPGVASLMANLSIGDVVLGDCSPEETAAFLNLCNRHKDELVRKSLEEGAAKFWKKSDNRLSQKKWDDRDTAGKGAPTPGAYGGGGKNGKGGPDPRGYGGGKGGKPEGKGGYGKERG